MRSLIPFLFSFFTLTGSAQLNNWDPSWYATDSALVFHDDLDYYLNGYSRKEIAGMRKQVNIWRMNFDRIMRHTIRDLRNYSEGHGMVPRTHPFTLPKVGGGVHTLTAGEGKIRAFMFGSITNPPARLQMERWSRLLGKYADEDVELFVIYGRELHPGDKKNFKKYPPPSSEAEKAAYAAEFAALGKVPVVIDGMDDVVFDLYGRAPNGAYLVDKDGAMIFRGTWADARKMEHMIDMLLKWYKKGKPRNFKPS